jgi:hypothetical protein
MNSISGKHAQNLETGRGKGYPIKMQDLSKIISAGAGPIIVISACGLLCLAFYNRLTAVVNRLRSFHRERLKEQESLSRARASAQPDPVTVIMHQEILESLQVQTDHVIARARLIRRALSCLLLTIACLAICSLSVGLSVVWASLMFVAVPFFVAGLLFLVLGVIFAMMEMYRALDPIELESRFVSEMGETIDRLAG